MDMLIIVRMALRSCTGSGLSASIPLYPSMINACTPPTRVSTAGVPLARALQIAAPYVSVLLGVTKNPTSL